MENSTKLQISPKRCKYQRRRPDLPRDFNVDVPDEVLGHIFSFLPVKNALRMSVVSRGFKNSWRYSRKLHFDQKTTRRRRFVRQVNRVFDLHEGPTIQSFRLRFVPIRVENYVLQWIQKAVEKKVEDVVLDFSDAVEPFKLSPEFLNIETIRILKLKNCELCLPPTPKFSTFLTTLTLRRILNAAGNLFITIFSQCMLLELLDITQCDWVFYLTIDARKQKNFKVLKIGDCYNVCQIDVNSPTLCSFHYNGGMTWFTLSYVPQLKDVLINFSTCPILFRPGFLMLNLFRATRHVTVLTTTTLFFESLYSKSFTGGITSQLRTQQWNLKEFQVFMQGSASCNVYDIASFIKICQRLEKLFIHLDDFSSDCVYYWDARRKKLVDESFQPLKNLKFIKIKGFKYEKHEVKLVRFLLRAATSLETLVLVAPESEDSRRRLHAPAVSLSDRLMQSWKASANAEIIKLFEDDMSRVDAPHFMTWFKPIRREDPFGLMNL